MKIKHFISILACFIFFNILTDTMLASSNLPAPQNLKIINKTIDTIELAWDEVEGAEEYDVFVAEFNNGEFEYLGSSTSNTYIHAPLYTVTTYYYKVRANSQISNEDNNNFSNIVSASISIESPKNLRVTNKTATSITLTWDEVEGATYYSLYRAESKNGEYEPVDLEIETNSFKEENLISNKTYFYKVTAVYDEDYYLESNESNIASASIFVNIPKNLKVSKTGTTISLTWNKVNDADGYEIWMSTSKDGNYKMLKRVLSNSFKHENLTPNNYFYKVRTYTATLKSSPNTGIYYEYSYSDYSTITTATIPLNVPNNIKISVQTPTSLTLSWNKVNNAEGYEIWMATTKNGQYKKVGTTTKTTFTHSKLTVNQSYYYKVRAYTDNKKFFSSYGSVISGKPVLNKAPTKFKISNKTYNSLTLSWGKVVNVTECYRL